MTMAGPRRTLLALIAAGAAAGVFAGAPGASAQAPPDTTAPVLSAATIDPAVVRPARGATLRFTLSEDARVSGRVVRRLTGARTRGGRCVPRTGGRRGAPCARYVAAGSFFAPAGAAGPNRAQLGVARLAAGVYALRLTPIDAAGNSGAMRSVPFRVAR
jgi:hypothetical protein